MNFPNAITRAFYVAQAPRATDPYPRSFIEGSTVMAECRNDLNALLSGPDPVTRLLQRPSVMDEIGNGFAGLTRHSGGAPFASPVTVAPPFKDSAGQEWSALPQHSRNGLPIPALNFATSRSAANFFDSAGRSLAAGFASVRDGGEADRIMRRIMEGA